MLFVFYGKSEIVEEKHGIWNDSKQGWGKHESLFTEKIYVKISSSRKITRLHRCMYCEIYSILELILPSLFRFTEIYWSTKLEKLIPCNLNSRWLLTRRDTEKRKAFTISFPSQHWGGRPPLTTDLLTTFDQIKSEPIHFYQQQHQAAVLQQNQVQNQQHVVHDDKAVSEISNKRLFRSQHEYLHLFSPQQQQLQHNDNIMPTLVDHIKPEIINPMPQQIIQQSHVGSVATTTTSRGSKPQACVGKP